MLQSSWRAMPIWSGLSDYVDVLKSHNLHWILMLRTRCVIWTRKKCLKSYWRHRSRHRWGRGTDVEYLSYRAVNFRSDTTVQLILIVLISGVVSGSKVQLVEHTHMRECGKFQSCHTAPKGKKCGRLYCLTMVVKGREVPEELKTWRQAVR